MKKSTWDYRVIREPLSRSDGTDTMYDALYREDGTQLAVVSRDYQLVTHRDAMGFVRKLFDHWKQDMDVREVGVTNQSKRMVAKIAMPGMKFRVNGDEFFPELVMGNSIDKSRSFTLDFGLFRLICTNGARIVIKQIAQVVLSHYQQNIRFGELEEKIAWNLDVIKSEFDTRVQRMVAMTIDAKALREVFTMEDLPVGFKVEVALLLQTQGLASFEWYKTSNIKAPDPKKLSVLKPFNGYDLWNALTSTSTHKVQSAAKRQEIEEIIAKKILI